MSDLRAPDSPREARDETHRLARKLEATTDLLETAVANYVEAEQAHTAADDDAWVEVRDEFTELHGRAPLTKDIQARVNRRCRRQLDELTDAEATMKGVEKRIRSLESQLSAAQSNAKSLNAEMDMGRYGPRDVEPPRAPHPGGRP